MVEEEKNENEAPRTDNDEYDPTTEQEREFNREQKEEKTNEEYFEYKLNSYGGSYDVESLVRRFEAKEIYRPDFQRDYVWSKSQASRFIDSILIKLPIPNIFLYENKDETFFIIDGLQRIATLHGFKTGKFPSDGKSFSLTGISKKSPYYGKTFAALDKELKRRINNTIIHIQFIEQRAPDDGLSATFNLFERLNTGGTPLHPQEMRNAIFGGSFQEQLSKLNTNHKNWRLIFDSKLPHKTHRRSKDMELILRFFSLYEREEKYAPR